MNELNIDSVIDTEVVQILNWPKSLDNVSEDFSDPSPQLYTLSEFKKNQKKVSLIFKETWVRWTTLIQKQN